MNLGSILTRSLQISWREKVLWLYAAIPFLLMLPILFIRWPIPSFTSTPSEAELAKMLSGFFVFFGVQCILSIASIFAGPLSIGGLLKGADLASQGESFSTGSLFQQVRPYYWRLLALPLLIFAAVAVVYVVFIGVAVGLSSIDSSYAQWLVFPLCCLFCLAIPVFVVVGVVSLLAIVAIVVDDLGVMQSLRKAWELFRAHLGPLVGFFVVLFMMSMIINMLFTGVLGVIQFAAMGTLDFTSTETILQATQNVWLRLLSLPQYFVMTLMIVFTYVGSVLIYKDLEHPE